MPQALFPDPGPDDAEPDGFSPTPAYPVLSRNAPGTMRA